MTAPSSSVVNCAEAAGCVSEGIAGSIADTGNGVVVGLTVFQIAYANFAFIIAFIDKAAGVGIAAAVGNGNGSVLLEDDIASELNIKLLVICFP